MTLLNDQLPEADLTVKIAEALMALANCSTPEYLANLDATFRDPVMRIVRNLNGGLTRDSIARDIFLKVANHSEPAVAAEFAFDFADAFVAERDRRG